MKYVGNSSNIEKNGNVHLVLAASDILVNN